MRMKVVTDPRHLHELILEASTSKAVVSSVSAKHKSHTKQERPPLRNRTLVTGIATHSGTTPAPYQNLLNRTSMIVRAAAYELGPQIIRL